MAFRTFFIVCTSALLVQVITAQCIGSAYNSGLVGYNNINTLGVNSLNNIAYGGLTGACSPVLPSTISNGGSLTIASSSPIAPSGVSVVSDNGIEGVLEVAGSLPVISAVGFEATVPSSGAAATTYSCGNGNVGIAAESLAASGIDGVGAGLGFASTGLGLGLAKEVRYPSVELSNAFGNAGLLGINGVRGCACGI